MQNHQHQRRMPQEIQPQRGEGTQEKDPYEVNHPRVFSPTNILRLQRTIGNQAVLRMADRKTSHIQRDPGTAPGADIAKSIGNVYEYKFDIEKGDRYAFSGAVSFSKTDTSPLKAKTESGLVGQLGESKATVSASRNSKGEYSAAHALALALIKTSYEMQPIPGVVFKYEMKTLEAKLDLMDISKLDVDMLKVAVAFDFNLTSAILENVLGDDILAAPLGELLRNGTLIKLTFKGEVKIHPDDGERLVKAFKSSQQIAKNAEAAAELVRQQQALLKQNADIGRRLSSVTDKAEKARLNRQFAKNRVALKKLGRALGENAENTKALRGVYNAAAKGLTSRAGRILGVKAAQIAARILTKAIPVVGWLLLAYDVGSLLYEVYKGAQSDFEQGGGTGGDSGAESGAAGGDGGADHVSADDMTDGGASEGGISDSGTSSGEAGASLPDVDIGGGLSDDIGGSEPQGSLPNVTDEHDDLSGGMGGSDGSLPGVTDANDTMKGSGGSTPAGETKNKAQNEEIVAGIQQYKGLMDAMGQSHYLGLPAECKKGETYQKWFFWYGSDQVHAIYTTVTIVERDGDRITVKLAPSSVYLEDGTFLPNDFEGDTMKVTVQQSEN